GSRVPSPARSSRCTSPPSAAKRIATRTGSSMSVDPSDASHVEIFDTPLRDGAQREGLSLTVEDKLRIAEQLDHLGLRYIEGGWPGANPKDDEFFARACAGGDLDLRTASMVAFGSTRK